MRRYLVLLGFLGTFDSRCLAENRGTSHFENSTISCKDDNGENVDWFIVYKFPYGTYDGYLFMTSRTVKQGWTVSNRTIQDGSNMIARTISRMYENDDENLWLAYNDNWWWFNRGHAKGIVGGDSTGGIWLVHSIPHFPKSRHYGYPRTGNRNAQGALCISMDASQLDQIGYALSLYVPHYDKKKFSSSLNTLYPTLRSALMDKKLQIKDHVEFNMTSRGEIKFSTFAKSKSFGKDIYEWIGSSLNTDLYVESWRNSLGPLPSSCNGPKIMNINVVQYKPKNLSFSHRIDHTKWAISADQEKPYVCIGDINRSKHQFSRGGGSVCVSHNDIWNAFNNIIAEKESC